MFQCGLSPVGKSFSILEKVIHVHVQVAWLTGLAVLLGLWATLIWGLNIKITRRAVFEEEKGTSILSEVHIYKDNNSYM